MSNEGSTGDEFSKSQLQKWEGQLSEEERARLAIIEWKNDQKVDFKKPLKDYPQIGIGLAGIATFVIGRILYYGTYKKKASKYQTVRLSNYVIATRFYAQGFFVLCAASIVVKPVCEYLWKKYVKGEDSLAAKNNNNHT
ncbi:uncharacterized protein LOC111099928 [Crassostrea virginica]|uniref:Uncharacterized protein LOC111099928 n=1 Tax=Crassostrea virginica TaxID=6565 RepID=A0A8B8A6R4_CRAVI|nr:uncharacterized protein LOC111099928 [Crassostrea virginica]|mmetsp:Transcript_41894/g.67216  ORF Transcript_41894/g.67216 Transcript_41894/m.67216 type:complete len:139 (+) Transcript_41894:227-643(+)